jgi:hypothetical protein
MLLMRSPEMVQWASRSIASLRLKVLSSMRARAASSSLVLCHGRDEGGGESLRGKESK